MTAGGASYVDGGIIGAPPRSPGDSRLYLSGPRAGEVGDLFAGTALDARVIGGRDGAASAVKMAYAAWTKGTAALILAIRALARAEGVEQTLLAEWELSQPALTARSHAAARSATGEGLALGRRNGGDRRDHGRRRPARPVSTRPPPPSTPASPTPRPPHPPASPRSHSHRRAAGRALSRLTGDDQQAPVHGRTCVSGKAFSRPDRHVRPGTNPALGVSSPSGVRTDRPRARRSRPGPGSSSRAPGRSPPGRSASRSRR